MIWSLVLLLGYAFPETIQPGERLVILGRMGSEFDGCSIQGRLTGTTSVRIAPSPGAAEKEKVRRGQVLNLCEEDGDFVAVVYKPSDDAETDCGVAARPPFVGAYRGPCRYGWVSSRAIELVEG